MRLKQRSVVLISSRTNYWMRYNNILCIINISRFHTLRSILQNWKKIKIYLKCIHLNKALSEQRISYTMNIVEYRIYTLDLEYIEKMPLDIKEISSRWFLSPNNSLLSRCAFIWSVYILSQVNDANETTTTRSQTTMTKSSRRSVIFAREEKIELTI